MADDAGLARARRSDGYRPAIYLERTQMMLFLRLILLVIKFLSGRTCFIDSEINQFIAERDRLQG